MANEPLTFRPVSLDGALSAGVEDLIMANEEEVYDDLAHPMVMDWPQMKAIERAGLYLSVGAFSRGALVGYSAWFVQPALRSRGQTWAIMDTTYLSPAYRQGSAGYRLVKAALTELEARGIDRAMAGSPNGQGRASFGDLLGRLGFSPFETSFAKTF